MSNPWDQQEGEPDWSYNHFLVYLGMGPIRSTRKAYCIFAGRPLSKKPVSVPGNWQYESKRWHWVRRARAYDRMIIRDAAQHVVAKLIHGFDAAALKSAREIQRSEPKGWKQALEGLALVSNYIPPQSIAEVALPTPSGEDAPYLFDHDQTVSKSRRIRKTSPRRRTRRLPG